MILVLRQLKLFDTAVIGCFYSIFVFSLRRMNIRLSVEERRFLHTILLRITFEGQIRQNRIKTEVLCLQHSTSFLFLFIKSRASPTGQISSMFLFYRRFVVRCMYIQLSLLSRRFLHTILLRMTFEGQFRHNRIKTKGCYSE